MKRIVTWLFALPIGIVVVALSVANRHMVTVALDPFRPQDPALAVSLPLFLLPLAAMILGVVLGGVAVWFGQGKYRKAARVGRREAVKLEAERSVLAAKVAEKEGVVAGLALPAPGGAKAA